MVVVAGVAVQNSCTSMPLLQERPGSLRFVEQPMVLPAVVQLAEEFVEEMAGGGRRVRASGGSDGGQVRRWRQPKTPTSSRRWRAVVLDVTVADADRAPGASGDGCRTAVGLQPASVGELDTVVVSMTSPKGNQHRKRAGWA